MTLRSICYIKTILCDIVAIGICLPSIGIEVTHWLAYMRLEGCSTIIPVSMREDIKTIGQLLYLILIEGDVCTEVNAPVFIHKWCTVEAKFSTRVSQLTDVHQH